DRVPSLGAIDRDHPHRSVVAHDDAAVGAAALGDRSAHAGHAGRLPGVERLRCPTCGNEVFFDSMRCVRCATELALDVGDDGRIDVADLATTVGCCRRAAWRCNWQAHDTDGPACPSCRIVDVPDDARTSLLVPVVAAQRRALWQLSSLGVGWRSDPGLRFVYRSRSAGDHAVIGHLGGQISLDLDEADPARGEQIRATLGEQYRTPLGHIRHELGHYVWL